MSDRKIKMPSKFTLFIKRAFDIVLSGVGILVLLPFFIIFTPIVAVKMKGNPFFTQLRPGKDEKIFRLIKYRTMTNEKDKEGQLLSDEKRLTKFGKTMRSLSIDELPELFNILVGDMSVVGPRPLLVRDLVFMSAKQRQRHVVRQGLTGLAQISGRNSITWEEKLEYDLDYIEEMSFVKDFKIILGTILKVLKKEGTVRTGTVSDIDFGDYLLGKGDVDREDYNNLLSKAKELMEV